MKILNVIYNYDLNGVSTFALTLINEMKCRYPHYDYYTYAMFDGKEKSLKYKFTNRLSYNEVFSTDFDLAFIHYPVEYKIPAQTSYFFVHSLSFNLLQMERSDKIFTFSERAKSYLNNEYDLNSELIRNYIDTSNFPYTPTCNNTFMKATLVAARKVNWISPELLKACSNQGVFINTVGDDGFNTEVIDYTIKIKESDLVFGVGRTAIESMSLGKNVYIINKDNNEGLITPDNFWSHAKTNFSGWVKKKSIYDTKFTIKELKKYDKHYGRLFREIIEEHFDIKKNFNNIVM